MNNSKPSGLKSEAAGEKKRTGRLVSLDALRGFDMFWIIGGGVIFVSLFNDTHWGWLAPIKQNLHHARGNGFTGYDLIFPLFVFLSGVTLGLSRKPFWELDWPTRRKKYFHAIRRLLLLIAMGIIYNRAHKWGDFLSWDNPRYASVLARIAIAWFFCAMIVWHTRWRWHLPVAVGILLGYWALHVFYTGKGTINVWVDQHYMPGLLLGGKMDPEGLLSHIPAVVNALLGSLVGRWIWCRIQLKKIRLPDGLVAFLRAGSLAIMGILLFKLGWLWDRKPVFGEDNALVLFLWRATSVSVIFSAIAYFVIDLRHSRKAASDDNTKTAHEGWTCFWLWVRRFSGAGLLLGIGLLVWILSRHYAEPFQVNKRLWTSSFVLVTSGWGCVLLAGFYLLIDGWGVDRIDWPWRDVPRYSDLIRQQYPIRGILSWLAALLVYLWRAMRWSWRRIGGGALAVIGANAIVVYFVFAILSWSTISERLLGGLYEIIIAQVKLYDPQMTAQDIKLFHNLLRTIGVVVLEWLILAWMYRKRIFIRI